MSLESNLNLQTVLKIDNASTTDLLSSWAGAFNSVSLISNKEANDLRISLNDLQCFDTNEFKTVTQRLEDSDSDFFDLVKNSFGDHNLLRNILRSSLRRQFNQSIDNLQAIATALIAKTPLVFNRPIYLYVEEKAEKLTLLSTVILDLVEEIESSVESMKRAVVEISTLLPADCGDLSLSEKLNTELASLSGFSGLCHANCFSSYENQAKSLYALGLKRFLTVMHEFLQTIQSNSEHSNSYSYLHLAIDQLSLQVDPVDKIEFPKSSSLHIWENRRLNLLAGIQTINASIQKLEKPLLGFIDQKARAPSEDHPIVSSEILRKTARLLTQAGARRKDAKTACENLVSYCNQKKINPSQLILAELKMIDPHFNDKTVKLLSSQSKDLALQNHSTHEKDRNANRVIRLSKVFGV